VKKRVELIRIGADLRSLRIDTKLDSKSSFGLKQIIHMSTQTEIKSTNSTNKNNKDYDVSLLNSDKFDNTAVINEFIEDRGELKTIDFNVTNSSLAFKFDVIFKKTNEEGLFIFSFFNCMKPSEKDLNLKNIKTITKTFENSNNYDENFDIEDNKEFRNGVNLQVSLAVKAFIFRQILFLKLT